jgi:hypothetical protein
LASWRLSASVLMGNKSPSPKFSIFVVSVYFYHELKVLYLPWALLICDEVMSWEAACRLLFIKGGSELFLCTSQIHGIFLLAQNKPIMIGIKWFHQAG